MVPDADVLAATYRRAARLAEVQRALERAAATNGHDGIAVPDDLAERVAAAIDGTAESWDAAVWRLANERESEERDT